MEHEIPDPQSIKQNGPAEITTTKVRQAVTLGRVRYVLTVSMVLAVAAFAIIYFAGP